jgi:hypothetical protein
MSATAELLAETAVKAELTYVASSAEPLRTYTYDPPPGVAQSNALPEPHIVSITNARTPTSPFSLDRNGFELREQHSAVRNFYDSAEVKSVYYPEAENYLKQITGADRVLIFDHTVRRRMQGAKDIRDGTPRQPATRIHVDQTLKSGPQRVRDLLPDEADRLLRGRLQIINLWRPIRGPLRDTPLTMCDTQSVADADLVPSALIYPDRTGEIYAVTFNPAHRWFYYPDMLADEVLLLKCYDSKTDGRARFAPHTAFTDPTTPAGTPGRESIELRALVFHDEA